MFSEEKAIISDRSVKGLEVAFRSPLQIVMGPKKEADKIGLSRLPGERNQAESWWNDRGVDFSGRNSHRGDFFSLVTGIWGQISILGHFPRKIPSDTKVLLTKYYSDIMIFPKRWISRVILWKRPRSPEILRGQNPSNIAKHNPQGEIFSTIFVSEGNPNSITPKLPANFSFKN